MTSSPPPLANVRYEVLPFGSAEQEAAATSQPLTLTVTCSPKQGMDVAVDVAARLRELGHVVVLHTAARMVRGPEHLHALLGRMADAGIVDVFLVAGDADRPLGPYRSGLDLIEIMRAHTYPPRSIGIPGYPEGHPLINDESLIGALVAKARHADYMTTQICFDPDTVLSWVDFTRRIGVDLPVYVGVPGPVDRRRLVEISMRVGVGSSIRFLRKQRGARRLFGRPSDATDRLVDAIAPAIGHRHGIAGLHFFTFNELVATNRYVRHRLVEHAGPALTSADATAGPSTYGPSTIQRKPRSI